MGDRRRFSPSGPRLVEDGDFREDEKPKVIRNPGSEWINANARFEPIVPVEQTDHLSKILDGRAGTQKGKPRSRDPEKNPLGARVFDVECGWPMYRVTYAGSFRYTCGYYQQSHGECCDHNHVGGPLLTTFALAAVRQRLFDPAMRERLVAKLRAKLAETPDADTDRLRRIEQKRGKLAEVEQQYQTAAGNLALASCPETFAAIEPKVKELAARKLQLASEIESLESSQSSTITPHESVDAAVDLLDRLPTLAEDPENLGSIGRLFQQIDLQVFLRFQSVRKTKRTVNQLSGGILTIGAVSAPIEKYAGPTGRRALKTRQTTENKSPAADAAGLDSTPDPARTAKSLGNVSRDDRI